MIRLARVVWLLLMALVGGGTAHTRSSVGNGTGTGSGAPDTVTGLDPVQALPDSVPVRLYIAALGVTSTLVLPGLNDDAHGVGPPLDQPLQAG